MSKQRLMIPSPVGLLEPLADHGVYVSTWNALLVADLHLGKETTFRRQGLAVPEGATDATLKRLTKMVHEKRPQDVWILGDLFHARSSLSAGVVRQFEAFLAAHPDVQFRLVRGNHDLHYQSWPRDWKLETVAPPVTINRVALAHYPGERPAEADMLICGHLHPAVRLQPQAGLEGRQACFALQPSGDLVLPALGRFTGTALLKRQDVRRVWLPLGGRVMELPKSWLLGS